MRAAALFFGLGGCVGDEDGLAGRGCAQAVQQELAFAHRFQQLCIRLVQGIEAADARCRFQITGSHSGRVTDARVMGELTVAMASM